MSDVLDKPTTSPISTRKHGDVLIVLSNNPPVNALSTAVRQGLVDAIAEAEADETVNAVVIACEGQTFFAGADITEFGKPPQQPWLPAVVDTIENCGKPVVAAIHGTALGGGLEVALALSLPRCRSDREARYARGQAWAAPGRGRNPTAPARRRSAEGARNVRHRQSDRREGGLRLRPGRPADRRRADPARGRLRRRGPRRAPAAQVVRAAGQAQ